MLQVKQYTQFDRIPLKHRQNEAMRTMIMWMDKLQGICHYWIWCGSFLWLYREWKFIDWDLDIDISATYNWNDDFALIEKNILYAFSDWKLIRTIHYKNRPFQIAFMSPLDVIFDITFYVSWIKDLHLVSYSDCWTVEEPEHLFKWPIPSPALEYLELRYWKDWNIPTWQFDPWNTYCKSLTSWGIVWI